MRRPSSPKPAASWTRRSTTATASRPATRSRGPAVVEEEGSTLVIGPAATAMVMPSGSIVVELAVMRVAALFTA